MLMTNFHFWLTFWYFCGEFQAYWKNVVLGNRLASRLSGFSLCELNIVKRSHFAFCTKNCGPKKIKNVTERKEIFFPASLWNLSPNGSVDPEISQKTRLFFSFCAKKRNQYSLFFKKGPFSDKHHDIGSVALPFFRIFFSQKENRKFSKPIFLEAVLLEESNKKD